MAPSPAIRLLRRLPDCPYMPCYTAWGSRSSSLLTLAVGAPAMYRRLRLQDIDVDRSAFSSLVYASLNPRQGILDYQRIPCLGLSLGIKPAREVCALITEPFTGTLRSRRLLASLPEQPLQREAVLDSG